MIEPNAEDMKQDEYDKAEREVMKKRFTKKASPTSKPWLMLPHDGMLVSEVAENVAEAVKPLNTIFYRTDLDKVVEITRIEADKDKKGNNSIYTGFKVIEPKRFVSLIENHMQPMAKAYDKKTKSVINKRRTMQPNTAEIILLSDPLIKNINKIERIFNVPIPIMYKGVLSFPKNGYDERFNSWLPYEAPTIDTTMTLVDAKKEIDFIFSEFCFKNDIDHDIAISALITPACRGLFSSWTTRTPPYVYKANRERCGKDYCAGITGILYEGVANEDAPLSSGDKNNNGSDELGKKVFSAMIIGRKRMHFANCRGHIENAAFEQITTGETYTGRILGQTKLITCNNEIDFSLSGNIGITYNGDFANRCRIINFFLEIENANSRIFKTPDLRGYVKTNRGKILSAIYCLINDWVSKGSKKGTLPFASFFEWAEVVGGIMENAGYHNPCVEIIDDDIGGDEEAINMKKLYEVVNSIKGNTWASKDELHDIISNDENLRDLYPISNRSEVYTLSNLLKKWKSRILGDIKLHIDNAGRDSKKYRFEKLDNSKMEVQNKILNQNIM
jgi:hypothetical protein